MKIKYAENGYIVDPEYTTPYVFLTLVEALQFLNEYFIDYEKQYRHPKGNKLDK